VDKRDENLKFIENYRWICLSSECIDNSNPDQECSYEQCLIHKQMQNSNPPHIPSHKMVLVRTKYDETEVIQTDGYEKDEEYKHQKEIKCNI
jgi:hypothetical protein